MITNLGAREGTVAPGNATCRRSSARSFSMRPALPTHRCAPKLESLLLAERRCPFQLSAIPS